MKKFALALVAVTLSTVYAVPVESSADRGAAKPAVVQPAANSNVASALVAHPVEKARGPLAGATDSASSMPEPSTFAMMALGLGLIGLTLGRRRNPR